MIYAGWYKLVRSILNALNRMDARRLYETPPNGPYFQSRLCGEQGDTVPTFLGFWHGPALGPLRLGCLRSFVDHGYNFEIYTYEEQQLPDGIIQRDANEIIAFDEMFYFANPHTGTRELGPFSDLFRFKLLSERRGMVDRC